MEFVMKTKYQDVQMNLACNFDSNSTDDDGSCLNSEQYYDCDGLCLNDSNGNGNMMNLKYLVVCLIGLIII